MSVKKQWTVILTLIVSCFLCLDGSHAKTLTPEVAESPSFLEENQLDCGGNLYNKTIVLWNEYIKQDVALNLIDNKLINRGDTYALYDIQMNLHEFLIMLDRCQDVQHIEEVAKLLVPTFDVLKRSTTAQGDFSEWVCRGCLAKNLNGREVFLYSVQYVAFLSDLLVVMSKIDAEDKTPFLKKITYKLSDIIMNHLYRWSLGSYADGISVNYLSSIASTVNVTDGSSKYFLTDKEIWLLVALMNMAKVANETPTLIPKIYFRGHQFPLSMKILAKNCLLLLQNRVFVGAYQPSKGARVAVAEIDRGYWRFYQDNQYAGYYSSQKPLDCTSGVKQKPIISKTELGWDFSHFRRFVRFFEVSERSNAAASKYFDIERKYFISSNTINAFVNQLVYRVWNQQEDFPLFSNYWNGENGWYRVGYNNGSNNCQEGMPPYGLSDSFPTGGYITWGRYNLTIMRLGQQLLRLSLSTQKEDVDFIKSHYPILAKDNKTVGKNYNLLMFYSSLIGVR